MFGTPESPLWVAADVCRVLGIINPRDAVSSLDEDEKITVGNPDGNPRAGIPHKLVCVSESGLYALIFKSRKAEAKAFRKRVTNEILPQIRRTGSYGASQLANERIARLEAENELLGASLLRMVRLNELFSS